MVAVSHPFYRFFTQQMAPGAINESINYYKMTLIDVSSSHRAFYSLRMSISTLMMGLIVTNTGSGVTTTLMEYNQRKSCLI